ncbi:unnamed protein product [Prorocentrum cordatum]|uniref:Uncharacterized protein n=1 Tax=Prorocentrum cordatum TaxID=2364126 RepID=A0ABN9Y0C9_9DINO|nr:unnamed protein product [Polarella glacialis]
MAEPAIPGSGGLSFGRRLQQLLHFNAEVRVGDSWSRRKVVGPSDFETWRKGWRVYRTAALILKISRAGPLDDFEEGARRPFLALPQHWGLIYVAVGHAGIRSGLASSAWASARLHAVTFTRSGCGRPS